MTDYVRTIFFIFLFHNSISEALMEKFEPTHLEPLAPGPEDRVQPLLLLLSFYLAVIERSAPLGCHRCTLIGVGGGGLLSVARDGFF